MNLSVVIVSYNVKEKLRENLQALFASEVDFYFEVFVVDNNSQDGTVQMLREEFPKVKLVANNGNKGFAFANNQVLKEAEGEYILLLNPDMRVGKDTLSGMTKWMDENPEAGIAGCKLVDEKNEIIKHVRNFPTFWDQLFIVLKLPHLFPNILDEYIIKDFDYSKSQKVDVVRGGFFMIRETVFRELGLLDERFFIWFEEVDYCKRASEKEIEVWYNESVKCLDYVGQSFKQVKSSVKQGYFRDSMLKYFKKWHAGWEYYTLMLTWSVIIFLGKIAELINFKDDAKT